MRAHVVTIDGRPARRSFQSKRQYLDNLEHHWAESMQPLTEEYALSWLEFDPNAAVQIERRGDVLTIWTTGGKIVQFVYRAKTQEVQS